MNMEYFNYPAGLRMTNNKFNNLFDGPPRKLESKLTQREMDLARSVQDVTEEIVLKIANHVYNETHQKNITLAGGVALNCVANGKLLREGPFENIWIQPASGDAGGALGAALASWYDYLEKPRAVDNNSDSQFGSYLGPEFNDDEIKSFINDNEISFKEIPNEEIPNFVSKLIAEENVIGWFQGRMEFGPRALGSRSILGDARSPNMQKHMNLKIKFRESFRPFAPSVLADEVSNYFDMDTVSPYMLLVADVKKDKQKAVGEDNKNYFGLDKLKIIRSEIPAITHVDYSARIQTVHKETNELYYNLIKKFNEDYGCPILINTSFNVRGEPIVCTPEDAYKCFMRTNMDYLIMGNYLLKKGDQKNKIEFDDWQKEYELD